MLGLFLPLVFGPSPSFAMGPTPCARSLTPLDASITAATAIECRAHYEANRCDQQKSALADEEKSKITSCSPPDEKLSVGLVMEACGAAALSLGDKIIKAAEKIPAIPDKIARNFKRSQQNLAECSADPKVREDLLRPIQMTIPYYVLKPMLLPGGVQCDKLIQIREERIQQTWDNIGRKRANERAHPAASENKLTPEEEKFLQYARLTSEPPLFEVLMKEADEIAACYSVAAKSELICKALISVVGGGTVGFVGKIGLARLVGKIQAYRAAKMAGVVESATLPKLARDTIAGNIVGPGTEFKVLSGVTVSKQKVEDALTKKVAEERPIANIDLHTAEVLKLDFNDQQKKEFLAEVDKMKAYGLNGEVAAKRIVGKLYYQIDKGILTPENALQDFKERKVPTVLAALKAQQANRVTVAYNDAPLAHPPIASVRAGQSMDEIEKKFDVLARKASSPKPANGVHEVDTAFVSRGIADRKILVSNNGTVQVPSVDNEKVLAVGYRGALAFDGKLSNKGGERFYAVIFPKGFVERFGKDLRTAGPNGNPADIPGRELFQKTIANEGKVFAIRSEPSNRNLGGQIHIQESPEFREMTINGKTMSQADWLRSQALGVAEFDADGNILKVLPLE